MEFFSDIQKKAEEFVSENASTLLTAAGVAGTVGTAVLAYRAGYKYQEIIREEEEDRIGALPMEERGDAERDAVQLSKTETFVLTWPHFVPPVLLGGFTIGCIIFSHRMSTQKVAGLAAAYGLSQKQYAEYKAKVEERLSGPKKDRPSDEELNAELAQDRVNQTPGANKIVIVDGTDDVLCFDEATGRYFKSSMEKINRAVNKTNEEIINGEYARANYFYDLLGLKDTTWGDEVGWNRDNLVDLDINVVMAGEDESKPCISINFKRMPDSYFLRRMYE